MPQGVGLFLGVPAALRHAVKVFRAAGGRLRHRGSWCARTSAERRGPRTSSRVRSAAAATLELANLRGGILARPRPNRKAASCPNASLSESSTSIPGSGTLKLGEQDARRAGRPRECQFANSGRDARGLGNPLHGSRSRARAGEPQGGTRRSRRPPHAAKTSQFPEAERSDSGSGTRGGRRGLGTPASELRPRRARLGEPAPWKPKPRTGRRASRRNPPEPPAAAAGRAEPNGARQFPEAERSDSGSETRGGRRGLGTPASELRPRRARLGEPAPGNRSRARAGESHSGTRRSRRPTARRREAPIPGSGTLRLGKRDARRAARPWNARTGSRPRHALGLGNPLRGTGAARGPASRTAEPAGAAGRRTPQRRANSRKRNAQNRGNPDAHGPRPYRLEALKNSLRRTLRAQKSSTAPKRDGATMNRTTALKSAHPQKARIKSCAVKTRRNIVSG